jgi:deoxycytidylate deaminase
MSSEIYEFPYLFAQMPKSGCAKKQTAAGTYVKGVLKYAVNFCEYQGDACPRLNMKSGEGYELCKANHAEANLAAEMQKNGWKSDGIAWVAGHYWACEPCASALKAVGVKEIRVKEFLEL